MNCKPGDLARIVGVPDQIAMARDRIVQLTNDPPFLFKGEPTWRLVSRVEFVMTGNGRSGSERFYVGESVYLDELQDKYLRPIRDPGEDAQDETLAWKPVPTKDEVPA